MVEAREDTKGIRRVHTKEMLPLARQIGPGTTQAQCVLAKLPSLIRRATPAQPATAGAVVTENSVRAGNAKILSACRHSLPEKLIEGTIQ
jgi:hypothetical protein